MATTIQIRNVPEELHRALKIRAAQTGMTLSDYLLAEIEQVATKPTLSELMDRVAREEPVELDENHRRQSSAATETPPREELFCSFWTHLPQLTCS